MTHLKNRTAVLMLTALLSTSGLANEKQGTVYGYATDKVEDFISTMKTNHNHDPVRLRKLFIASKLNSKLIEQLSKPKETKITWNAYQSIFVTEKRIDTASRYCAKHIDMLTAVQEFYGAEPEIICAILAVETYLGKITGSYEVLPTLANLAFVGTNRVPFFTSELEHFLLLSKTEDFNLTRIKGSYAGAMGHAQFISSSYRRLAVDFDCDGSRDLWHSYSDIFGSIGSYFQASGWKYSEPLTIELEESTVINSFGNIKDRQLLKVSDQEVRDSGIMPLDKGKDLIPSSKGAVYAVKDVTGMRYWYGYNNYLSILKYNGAVFYGMVVSEIHARIKDNYKKYLRE